MLFKSASWNHDTKSHGEHTEINNNDCVANTLHKTAFGTGRSYTALQWQKWNRTNQLAILGVGDEGRRP